MNSRDDAGRVDEDQVERDVKAITQIRNIAWQRNPQDVMALINRLRVQLMVEELPRRRRRYIRALIEYYEDVLEERLAKMTSPDSGRIRRSAVQYLRDFIKGMEDD